ncbi:hypothetical protein Angca_000461, partial [Angiostrongylus cantonensis]
DSETLIITLMDKLDNCQPRSTTVPDQRKLFEHLQLIVTQLEAKGENVDNHGMFKKILTKFSNNIQRKVIEKKHDIVMDKPFQMQQLFQLIQDVISKEEKVWQYTSKCQSIPMVVSKRENKSRSWISEKTYYCMYCKADHKAFNCNIYKTPYERSQYLRTNKLCAICASPYHDSTNCKKSSCFKCQRRHHTSCCLQSTSKETSLHNGSKSVPNSNKVINDRKYSSKETKTYKPTSKINYVNQEQEEIAPQETIVLEIQPEGQHPQSQQTTILPTAEITVVDTSTGTLKKVQVLLDTGAELSFIDASFAAEMDLPVKEETKLRLYTFGSDQAQEKPSNKVSLKAWDADGRPFSMLLYTHDNLVKPYVIPPISTQDTDFIQQRELPVHLTNSEQKVKPTILLGSDQLWSLVKDDQPHITLPSGLHLLPTRLGHIITGRTDEYSYLTPEEQDNETTNNNEYTTPETLNNFASHPVWQLEDEHDKNWEKYLTLESAGTEEFSNSEKEIRMQTDRQVWEKFNQTIEKRPDGYYVCLPWKETTTTKLPDNKVIALSRLNSVCRSLQNNQRLMEEYNNVFAEQLRLNILEKVDEGAVTKDSRLHYIPHQAILTPNKNTKMRVVYDASAHYKGCPSLNDLLHRGPVILPELFGILLRFRFGRFAITSDIEEAFLQVRLHEIDRDSTRCLWLHDHRRPPTPNNIKTLRFTRITFGLITSPFLLAGTIHFHLDQYGTD